MLGGKGLCIKPTIHGKCELKIEDAHFFLPLRLKNKTKDEASLIHRSE